MTLPRYRDPLYVAARAGWSTRVAAGQVTCHLCHLLIVGAFDLDHVRHGAGALAPTHPRCNRSEGGSWRGKRRLEWGSSGR